jgi:hypothetical protein
MAYINSTAAPAAPGLLRRFFGAVVNGLDFLANVGPMTEQVRRLNALSDEDLAARGTTRSAEVARIFGPRALL